MTDRLHRREGIILTGAVLLSGVVTAEENCCITPFSYFDCTGTGHLASPGKLYTCIDVSEVSSCMSCLRNADYSDVSCDTCCSIENLDCTKVDSEWDFYASTLFFICLCCCFTALCGLTEVRRKKKGISFAQAWSVPQAMPILRTWPRRSASSSDMSQAGGEVGTQWAALSDDEEDLKRYPVAGLVDDSGMAFGFVTTLPQTLLSSVATSLRQAGSPSPPSPQEPELTVWISRDNEGASASAPAHRGIGGGSGASAVTGVEANSSEESSRGSSGATRAAGGRQQRAVVVGNDLEEPLMLDGVGTGPGRGGGAAGGIERRQFDGESSGRAAATTGT
ncbi:unnamed protein product [Ectocarpus sp. CCAP 1310/34]|nr:unnamed protein product [Ectocarpus sp. CCAP 1310/34]